MKFAQVHDVYAPCVLGRGRETGINRPGDYMPLSHGVCASPHASQMKQTMYCVCNCFDSDTLSSSACYMSANTILFHDSTAACTLDATYWSQNCIIISLLPPTLTIVSTRFPVILCPIPHLPRCLFRLRASVNTLFYPARPPALSIPFSAHCLNSLTSLIHTYRTVISAIS